VKGTTPVTDHEPGSPQEPPARHGVFGPPRITRAERIRRDIERGRNSPIPTWMLAVTLGVLVAAWVLWIVLG
jgi:hypothetical protein